MLYNTLADAWGSRRVTAHPLVDVKPMRRHYDDTNREWIENDYSERDGPGADLILRITFPKGQTDDF